MDENRKSLISQLKDTVDSFKNRKTVGRMDTEHSIFIPSALMVDKSEETDEFIKAAKHINNNKIWNCKVLAEKVNFGTVSGIEFVFQFKPDTDFDSIIEYIDQL